MRTPAQIYRDVRQHQADRANEVTRDEQWWPATPEGPPADMLEPEPGPWPPDDPAAGVDLLDAPYWPYPSPGAHREPLDLVPDEISTATPHEAGLTDDPSVDWGHFAGPGADAAREGELGGISNVRNPREWAEMMQDRYDREPEPEGNIPGMGPMSLAAERALEAAQGPAEPEAGQ